MSSKRAGDGPTLLARAIATYGRTALLLDDEGTTWSAVRRGRRTDLVVGDRVRATVTAPGQAAVESIEPRTSLLYRTDVFRTKELAANIDQVIIVFASRPSFNLWFLWKALVAARAAGIEAVVVRNKTDLSEGADAAQAALEEIAALGWRTLAMARTREFSERLDLGKQTTTAARWFALPGGGAVVDTPGFQEFGLAHLDAAQIVAGFPEFSPFLGQCRFADCSHRVEPGCAILAALASGAITRERHQFYAALSSGGAR